MNNMIFVDDFRNAAGDFEVTCNDGTKDVGNGAVAPCLSNGGVKSSVLDAVKDFKSKYTLSPFEQEMNKDCGKPPKITYENYHCKDGTVDNYRRVDKGKCLISTEEFIAPPCYNKGGVDYEYNSKLQNLPTTIKELPNAIKESQLVEAFQGKRKMGIGIKIGIGIIGAIIIYKLLK